MTCNHIEDNTLQEHTMSHATPDWTRPASLESWGAAIRRQRESLHLTLDVLAIRPASPSPTSPTSKPPAPRPPLRIQTRPHRQSPPTVPKTFLAGADFLRAPESIRKALTAKERPRRPDGTVNLDQLVSPSTSAPADQPAPDPDHLALRPVPLINRVAAGKASEFTDLSYPTGVADQYVQVPDFPEAPAATAFALRVLGDSMSPDYREGEVLVVGPGDPRDGDDCVIRLAENENFATTFKRIFFVRDDQGDPTALRLVPLNRAHPERQINLTDITGIYPLLYRLVPRHPPKSAGQKPSERIKG